MEDRLIYDVGAHKGEDTAFCLSKGFRVVAIEANPAFCQILEQRFQDELSMGALIIINTAVAQRSGMIDFFVNENISVWGTTKQEWVERNRTLRDATISQIQVRCQPLSRIIEQYGVPHYCKIDIEGADLEALASLAEHESPRFVSIEATKTSWEGLMNEFKLFRSLGYRKFKVIDQSLISTSPEIFPSPGGVGVTSLAAGRSTFALLHLATIPNRRIDRMTVTWFQASPPRGVLMPRLVNASAISRRVRSRIASKMGRRSASRAAQRPCSRRPVSGCRAPHRAPLGAQLGATSMRLFDLRCPASPVRDAISLRFFHCLQINCSNNGPSSKSSAVLREGPAPNAFRTDFSADETG
jgi:FkbM family methyltransferase